MTTPKVSTSTALIVVAVMFGTTVLAVTLAFILAPEHRDPMALVVPVIGLLGPTLATLLLVLQVRQVDAKVVEVAKDAKALTNGLLDSKVRAGFADVAPHLVHPEAEALVDEDRRTRAAAHDHTVDDLDDPTGIGDPDRP